MIRFQHLRLPLSATATAIALLGALTLLSTPARAGTEGFDKQMGPIFEEYARVRAALASDSTEGVAGAAARIEALAGKLDTSRVTGEHADHYRKLPDQIQASARKLREAKGLEGAREAFKELSRPLAMWVTMSEPAGLNVVYCSMAKGSWVQKGATVANPYMGAKMLRCGDIVAGADKGRPEGHGSGQGHQQH